MKKRSLGSFMTPDELHAITGGARDPFYCHFLQAIAIPGTQDFARNHPEQAQAARSLGRMYRANYRKNCL